MTESNGKGRIAGLKRPVVIFAVVAAVGVGLWATGALDEPLSQVGLNSRTCAENLFGNRICGDDLVRFCEERYDPDINAETCEPVLRDAGKDPEALLARKEAEQRARQHRAAVARRRRAAERRRRARRPGQLGRAFRAGAVAYTVRSFDEVSSIPGLFGDAIQPRAGHKLWKADVRYSNEGTRPVDLLCSVTAGGEGFAMQDDRGRTFTPNSDAMLGAPENDEGCSEKVQPGDVADAAVIFDVRASVHPATLLVWDPDQLNGPEEGGSHIAIPVGAS